MTRRFIAYLLLERLMMEADDEGDGFADELRDTHLDPLWNGLSADEKQALNARAGTETDELNPTRIEVGTQNAPPSVRATIESVTVVPNVTAMPHVVGVITEWKLLLALTISFLGGMLSTVLLKPFRERLQMKMLWWRVKWAVRKRPSRTTEQLEQERREHLEWERKSVLYARLGGVDETWDPTPDQLYETWLEAREISRKEREGRRR